MQLGILGLPKVGKTTLFNTLTASEQETDKFATSSKTHLGLAQVPDPRLEDLRDLFGPKRYTPASVEYVDIPGVRKGEGSESLDLAKLKTVDALVHVVRIFEDDELLHTAGDLDPGRDIESLDHELILADMILVESRIERLSRGAKGGQTSEEKRAPNGGRRATEAAAADCGVGDLPEISVSSRFFAPAMVKPSS